MACDDGGDLCEFSHGALGESSPARTVRKLVTMCTWISEESKRFSRMLVSQVIKDKTRKHTQISIKVSNCNHSTTSCHLIFSRSYTDTIRRRSLDILGPPATMTSLKSKYRSPLIVTSYHFLSILLTVLPRPSSQKPRISSRHKLIESV